MLSKRLIKSNDAGGGICQSDITDIFEDGSGVALYQLNWDGSDMSGNYDGVATDVSFVNGKIDSAGSFNGSSSYISLPDNSFNLTTLTLSVWINVTTFDGEKWIFDGYDEIPGLGKGFGITTHTGNKVKFRAWGSGFSEVISNTTLSTNTWYNVTCVATQSQAKVYINGSLDNTGSLTGIQYASAQKYNLGAIKKTGGNPLGYFTGKIDQVRIFNTAITDTNKIAQLAAETACVKTCTTDTPQLVPDCVAYYKLDGNADDSNGTATVYDGTPTNVSWTQGRLGSAAGFNGSSTSKITTSLGINPNNAFSMSFWIKSDLDNTWQSFGAAGTSDTVFTLLQKRGDNNAARFVIYNNAVVLDLTDTTTMEVGVWTHYSITLTGSVGNLYKNGVNTVSNVSYSASINYPNLTFGQRPFTPSEFFNGSIDQVRIYDRAITATEVTTLYNEVACPSGLNFNTVIYTGNGGTQNVGGVEFQSDLVWIKSRTDGTHWHILHDSIRGVGNRLFPNEANAESYYSSSLQSFDTNGFTVGADTDVNANGDDTVAWCWKAGGDAVTNTIGTITSDVSANQDAGFSIVKVNYGSGEYTKTVGHGLSQQPELIISKVTDSSSDWFTFSEYGGSLLGTNNILKLNTTAAATSDSFFDISTSTFKTGYSTGAYNAIAYCFHSVAGYQKVGSYTGTGANGNSINVGFKPRWIMFKRTDSTGSWFVLDGIRNTSDVWSARLEADVSNAEAGPDAYTVTVSNTGFEMTGSFATFSGSNASGGTYIYLAIA